MDNKSAIQCSEDYDKESLEKLKSVMMSTYSELLTKIATGQSKEINGVKMVLSQDLSTLL